METDFCHVPVYQQTDTVYTEYEKRLAASGAVEVLEIHDLIEGV